MSCARFFRFPTIAAGLAVAASTSCATLRAPARGVTVEFRPPSIVLAYPAGGVALPADKPLVVLRFEVGQRDDPIDPRAFRATLDGVDHTARFRVGATPAPNVGRTQVVLFRSPHSLLISEGGPRPSSLPRAIWPPSRLTRTSEVSAVSAAYGPAAE